MRKTFSVLARDRQIQHNVGLCHLSPGPGNAHLFDAPGISAQHRRVVENINRAAVLCASGNHIAGRACLLVDDGTVVLQQRVEQR